jgi:RNA-directed DNA polymerase
MFSLISGRLFRYADDFIVLCGSEEDAQLALRLIGERVTEFGLTLHPDKTFLRNLTNPAVNPLASNNELRGITFLGYELVWTKSGDRSWEFKGRTAPGRRAKALAQWDEWLKDFRREQITQGSRGISHKQIDHLLNSAVSHIQGFSSYYLVEGNQGELARYEEQVRGVGARYWNRYIDPHQKESNPFEDDREWLWHNIKMRKLTELSGKPSNSAFTSEKPLRGKEAAWDR